MQVRYRRLVVLLTMILCCAVQAQIVDDGDDTIVTLIFTNDLESAYEPQTLLGLDLPSFFELFGYVSH